MPPPCMLGRPETCMMPELLSVEVAFAWMIPELAAGLALYFMATDSPQAACGPGAVRARAVAPC